MRCAQQQPRHFYDADDDFRFLYKCIRKCHAGNESYVIYGEI